VGTVQDITARKEAEAVLARDKEELERLVAQRTERLQELVGELEHFSYTITHDLKSPLRAMRSFAEMMSMTCGECEPTQAREFLGRISTSAERMDKLIADALNYSRSVRQELPLEDVDAGALLRGMLDSYPELQPDKAQIRVEGRLPVVLANEAGLTRVFSNLLGNAVKFVKAGEKPEIRVWSSRRGEWVQVWVEDKGIGISKEMMPRVFDMFSRGSKDYEGTGIGLALVRKVAQRMGGKVGVESEEGRGSRFWIELKSGEENLGFGPVGAPAAVGGEEGMVLYVEDEESDAMFMARAFAEKGLAGRLRLVGTGRAAIDYLSGSGEFGDREKYPVPGLVLLDLNLPQVSGFGVLEWIRNNPDFARLPVVVFSSSTREDDRVKARELGADDFVAKPNSGLKFGEVVVGLQQRWLGKRRGKG
jgi:CheY-like chemotaxis protein/nitrogen-specific signal transduction histidine kinase